MRQTELLPALRRTAGREGRAPMAEYIVDTTEGILHARTTGEPVRCGDCIHFGRRPMRKGDGNGYCRQAKRREERNGE